VIDDAAPPLAEDTLTVGVVDHGQAAEFLGQRHYFVEGRDVTVHAEDAVGDDQFSAGWGAGFQLTA
jgi:hypothetical protein